MASEEDLDLEDAAPAELSGGSPTIEADAGQQGAKGGRARVILASADARLRPVIDLPISVAAIGLLSFDQLHQLVTRVLARRGACLPARAPSYLFVANGLGFGRGAFAEAHPAYVDDAAAAKVAWVVDLREPTWQVTCHREDLESPLQIGVLR
jgi:hypothetical protein